MNVPNPLENVLNTHTNVLGCVRDSSYFDIVNDHDNIITYLAYLENLNLSTRKI